MLFPFLPIMNRLLRLALFRAALVPAALSAASFEGKVSLKLSAGASAAQEMQYLVKGDKVRMEMPPARAWPPPSSSSRPSAGP